MIFMEATGAQQLLTHVAGNLQQFKQTLSSYEEQRTFSQEGWHKSLRPLGGCFTSQEGAFVL